MISEHAILYRIAPHMPLCIIFLAHGTIRSRYSLAPLSLLMSSSCCSIAFCTRTVNDTILGGQADTFLFACRVKSTDLIARRDGRAARQTHFADQVLHARTCDARFFRIRGDRSRNCDPWQREIRTWRVKRTWKGKKDSDVLCTSARVFLLGTDRRGIS